MKPNMIKKWSIALLVAAGAAGLTGCEGMRVDEGASSATNNGNVNVAPDGATLKANLSGTVVDDFGRAMTGVTVYAYGKSTTTDDGGNWVMNNVPVTGVNINSTPQNLEQTTDVTTSGSIYISYTKPGYAEYKSKISNPAVITHYGTAGGNPNSIIVDNLVASEAVQLPQLINTVSGLLIDRGSYYEAPVGEYDMASGITVRLIPAIDVVNNAYGSAAQQGAGATECYEGCGFYSVSEMVSTTDADGIFVFNEVPKIPGGYILRVDNAGYRPVDRPNDGTGFSYDYDQGPLISALDKPTSQWTVTTQSTLDPAQNYWSDIDFDVKTTGAATFLEDLYVGDYLVANNNVVEGITVGGRYGTVDDNSGEISDDGHNALGGVAAGAVSATNNTAIVDSNLVDLGVTPLKFVFSGDMIDHAAGELPERAIVIFDNAGAQVAWDSTKTTLIGRTLTLHLSSTPAVGTDLYVRLHKDVFADMAGKRLEQTNDPNDADYSEGGGGGDAADPAEIVTGGSKAFYAEFKISYTDPLIVPDAVEDFKQSGITTAIPATGSLSATDLAALQSDGTAATGDARIEELYDAILVRSGTEGIDYSGIDADVTNFSGDTAIVEFTAVNNAIYRLRIRDENGVLLTTMTDDLTGANIGGDEEDEVGNVVNVASGTDDGVGTTFIDFKATVGATSTSSTAKVTVTNAEIGYTAAIVRLNDFGDEVASSAVKITLGDNFEPHVAIQNSNFNGQDTTFSGAANKPAPSTFTGSIGTAVTAGAVGAITSANTAEVLYECGIDKFDDNGEAEVGSEVFYFPKLNLSASLYDKSNNRAHTETGELLSTASTAEDQNNALAGNLIANALNTPLLATTAATVTAVGTTASSRSDEYYNAADYDAWGLKSTSSGGPACVYYVAELSNTASGFTGKWYVGDSTGKATGTLATAVDDDDNDQDTIPDFPEGTGFTLAGTYDFDLNTVPTTTIQGNYVVGPAGCDAPGTNTYDYTRTVVLNMTEAVKGVDDLAAFKETDAACDQDNVVAGSDLDTNLTAIAAATSGWNNDHLLLTLTDWRTIDNSRHYEDFNQTQIANNIARGASEDDLLQIVSLTDAANTPATAGNGRGVLIVDATPALMTSLVNNGSSITITFDQPIYLGTTANTFRLTGDDGENYDFSLTKNAAGTVSGTVARTAGAAFFDKYGEDLTDASAVAVSVTASNNNQSLQIAVSATTDDAANPMEYSLYFNDLSHNTANSAANDKDTADPTFHSEYVSLRDSAFNSWSNVETYDQYDGNDGGTAVGPKLVGVDSMAPKLMAEAADATPAADEDNTYLYEVTAPFTFSSAHGTLDVDTDRDVVFTAAVPVSGGGGDTVFDRDNEEDWSLYLLWGYKTNTGATNSTTQSMSATLGAAAVARVAGTATDATGARAVLTFTGTGNGLAVVAGTQSYIYRPSNADIDTGFGLANVTAEDDFIVPSIAVLDDAAGTVTEGNVAVSGDGASIIVGIRNYGTTRADDVLVIEDIADADGNLYTIHASIPSFDANSVTANNLSTGQPTVKVYRKVSLDGALGAGNTDNDASVIEASTQFTINSPDVELGFVFRENLSAATASQTSIGEDIDSSTDPDQLSMSTASAAASSKELTLTVAYDGSEGSAAKFVGHNATIRMTATDFSSNTSAADIILGLGNGSSADWNNDGANEVVDTILNKISDVSGSDSMLK